MRELPHIGWNAEGSRSLDAGAMNNAIAGRILTPAVSLAGGLATLFLFRRGIGFAPFSLGIAVFAWISAVVFSRRFEAADSRQEDAASPSRLRRIVRWLSRSVVVGLYQNVLFFLLPIWFGSAEIFSLNAVFPLLLASLALFSCFDETFANWVLKKRFPRTLTSAVLLFSASVPAVSVRQEIPLRLGVALSAGAATFFASALGSISKRRFVSVCAAFALASVFGVGFFFLSRWLPPVPVQCVSGVASAGIEDRRPVEVSDVFHAGVEKVHAHFSVAAPERFKQKIRFQWYVDGAPRGKPIPSAIKGGRKLGFRTWTYLKAPGRGEYRVDLETDGGQLIGRVGFSVR